MGVIATPPKVESTLRLRPLGGAVSSPWGRMLFPEAPGFQQGYADREVTIGDQLSTLRVAAHCIEDAMSCLVIVEPISILAERGDVEGDVAKCQCPRTTLMRRSYCTVCRTGARCAPARARSTATP
jgi:hypothetical protein